MAEYRDPTSLSNADKKNVLSLIAAIRQKMYGKDVRDAIATSLEIIDNAKANSGKIYNVTPINFDFDSKKMIIPSGVAVFGAESAVTANEKEVDLPNTISWVGFDFGTKDFFVGNNLTDGQVVVGWIHNLDYAQLFSGVYNLNGQPLSGYDFFHNDYHVFVKNGYSFSKNKLTFNSEPVVGPTGGSITLHFKTNTATPGNQEQVLDLSLPNWFYFNPTSQSITYGQKDNDGICVGFYDGTHIQLGSFTTNQPADDLPLLPSEPLSARSTPAIFPHGTVIVDPYNHKLIFDDNFEVIMGKKNLTITIDTKGGSQPSTIDISGNDYIRYYYRSKTLVFGASKDTSDDYSTIVGYSLNGGEQFFLNGAKEKILKHSNEWLFLGNSIGAGVNTSIPVVTYLEQGMANLGLNLNIDNHSIGSTSIPNDTGYLPDQSYLKRLPDLSSDYSNVIIQAGENEFTFGVTLGDVDSDDMSTIGGALPYLIKELRKRTTGALFFVGPVVANYQGNDWRTYKNKLGLTVFDYINFFKQICDEYQVIYIDQSKIGYTPWDSSISGKITVDGLHPNSVGSKTYAGNILRCLFSYALIDDGYTADSKYKR